MVSIKENTMTLARNSVQIERWEVWFMTPFGVTNDVETAKKIVEDRDLDPDLTIVPVPVAISGSDYEIVTRQ